MEIITRTMGVRGSISENMDIMSTSTSYSHPYKAEAIQFPKFDEYFTLNIPPQSEATGFI
jgi:hypothetical protein